LLLGFVLMHEPEKKAEAMDLLKAAAYSLAES